MDQKYGNAYVKGNSLDCYDWQDGDDILVLWKISEIDAEHNTHLYKVLNIDNGEYAGVTTDQIVFTDNEEYYQQMQPQYDNSFRCIGGSGLLTWGVK